MHQSRCLVKALHWITCPGDYLRACHPLPCYNSCLCCPPQRLPDRNIWSNQKAIFQGQYLLTLWQEIQLREAPPKGLHQMDSIRAQQLTTWPSALFWSSPKLHQSQSGYSSYLIPRLRPWRHNVHPILYLPLRSKSHPPTKGYAW